VTVVTLSRSSVGDQQCLKLRKTCTCRYIRQRSKVSTGQVNHGCIMYRVPSFLQPGSLIPKNSMHRLQQI